MSAPDPLPRLLTFAPMIDSETTRLVCRWYGVDHAEDDHLFGWVSLLTLLHGGYGRVPLIYGKVGGEDVCFSGPRPLVDHCEPLANPARRLLPAGAVGACADADWGAYNGGFAVDVAVFSYFHLLPARDLMEPIFASPVPRGEARLTPAVFPLLRWLFTVLLRLSAPRAQAAGGRIAMVFSALDRRLADGRRFLQGDRLTLGDIGVAGAAAPLLQPPGYGAKMPPVEAMPAPLRDLIEPLRGRACAAYVERVYAAL
jgi:glutathione S-transferase